jgi:iron complex transport system substrate-binding protein
MKTKKKMIALAEIAIVLCSMLLVAIPAIAAQEQNQAMQKVGASAITTASKDDYVLDIYGNANEDDTIDMGDVVYTKLAIFGKKPKTELCDAKYDGRINVLDVIQTKLIILGKEKELTFIDFCEKSVTVKKPVRRIVVLSDSTADAIRVLGAEDRVVGIGSGLASENILLPVMSELPTVGGGRGQTLDYEAILDLQPDIILPPGASSEELEKKVNPWVTVVRFDFYGPEIMTKQIMELGYLLDKEDKAKEFSDFYLSVLNKVKERTEELSEDKKPRVFYCAYPGQAGYRYYAITTKGWGRTCTLAGGNNIAADLPANMVDPEWVLVENPDIIVAHEGSGLPSGYDTDDITGAKKSIEQMVNEPGWDHIKAVVDGKVYIETSDIDCGPQLFIVIAYMANWFYPELFGDLDPEAIHQEYLTRFQRIDYDLDEHGVFVYPPIEIDGGLAGIPDRYKGEI